MVCEQEIHFDPKLRLLVCKTHGFGIHPTPQAITRHLRGEGHHCRGTALKLAISKLTSLPLSSVEELVKQCPSVETQPISPPVPNLRILPGWMCLPCNGHYLTTSLELAQRHAASRHRRRRGDTQSWERCWLQTFFQETKDRRYFRVKHGKPAKSTSLDAVGSTSHDNVERGPIRSVFTKRRHSKVSLASLQRSATPHMALTAHHPFALLAQEHISGFSIEYLDNLFKSTSFTTASEPLFDPSHVDNARSMQSVFPTCDDEPLFYYALVYSMIRSYGGREPTLESVMLEKAMVDLINQQEGRPRKVPQATIGAIMLLKTTAYKLEDAFAHRIHSQGLTAALALHGSHQLTAHARRALFWQDVYAAVFLDCSLAIEPLEIFDNVEWAREMRCDNSVPGLPAGFQRHEPLLPRMLLDVITDLREMQAYLPILVQLPRHMRYQHLDSMQASIEFRLVQQASECRAAGPVAEGVRLALFLCCYCSWMEIWNDHYIPCKLAEKLLDVLEPTIATHDMFLSSWRGQMDLLLWLVYVCSNVVEIDQGRVGELRLRGKQLLCSIEGMLHTCDIITTTFDWERALADFLYCEWWSTDDAQS